MAGTQSPVGLGDAFTARASCACLPDARPESEWPSWAAWALKMRRRHCPVCIFNFKWSSNGTRLLVRFVSRLRGWQQDLPRE